MKISKTLFVMPLILASVIFLSSCCNGKCVPSSSGTVELFNGKNLDGWYTYLKGRGKNVDPLNVFTVKDGVIRISGEEWGCITSNEEFENYRIIVEYKWGDKTWGKREPMARDSGLLLHSVGEDGAKGGFWMYSIESNIIEGGSGDFIVVGDNTPAYALTAIATPTDKPEAAIQFDPVNGKPMTMHKNRINWIDRDPDYQNVKNFRGKKDVEKPVGEWNRMECVCDGGKIDVYLNGKLINQGFGSTPSKGKIQIQSEGAEIFVRRVDIIPLK